MLSLLLALTVSLVGTPPDEEDAEVELEAGLVDEDDEDEPPVAAIGKRLVPRMVGSLITVDDLVITLDVESADGEDSATITVRAPVHHEFDGTVAELELGVSLLAADELEWVWERLHTPPLQLTAAQIERKLPTAIATVALSDDDEPFDREENRVLAVSEVEEGVTMPRVPPAALVAVTSYVLESPSERDVLRIFADGGPADLGAIAAWARMLAMDGTQPFDEAARTRIVAAADARIRSLRAPPAFGDFQRINALTAVIYACVGPGDLERLLVLERPLSILLAGAVVSYDDAIAEENMLGISVHGFGRVQSRSDASVQWEAAMQRVRGVAVDRLLRLAFDPLDFRSAPPAMRRHPLQVAATELLAPIATIDVARVLALAGERTEVQAGVLAAYIEVAHAPVVEPLLDWLVTNPGHIDGVGMAAMGAMGEVMLPVLLRRLGDFEAPLNERAVVWRLLAGLPESHAGALAQACSSLGVELPLQDPGHTPTVAELLQAIRAADALAQQRRVEELIARVRDGDEDRVSLGTRVRAVREIAELAPPRLLEIADEAIAVHVAAARDLASDGPTGPRVVLHQLRELPLGERSSAADHAAAGVEAELVERDGDRVGALAIIERIDPELDDEGLRATYIAIFDRRYQQLMADGAWHDASTLVEHAATLSLVELDVERRRETIVAMKRRPLLLVGIALATVVTLLVLVLLHRTGVLARLRRRSDDTGGVAGTSGGLDDPPHEELAEAWARREDDTRSPLDDFAA